MNPLMFVNWASVNAAFRGIMWLLAVGLAGYVLVTAITPQSVTPHRVNPRAVLVGR